MDKILLINPPWEYPIVKKGYRHNHIWPPLSLANTAALLEKANFDVKILDANTDGQSSKQIVNYSKNFDKVFITSSPLDKWQCPYLDISSFLGIVRKLEKNNLFIIGAHGTIRPKEILNKTKAKAVIRGEPELITLSICKDKKLKDIKGITYKKKNRIISTPNKEPLNLKKLPIPAFHLLPMKKYFYEFLGNNFTLFETSRGCPYNCIYCLKDMYGKGYRSKSANQVINEIDYAIKNFNIKNAYFIDLEFTLNKNLVKKICQTIIKRNYNLKWCCQTRLDAVDLSILKLMKKAGCQLIHYGVETGSSKIMKIINKKISLEQIKRGINLTKKARIKSVGYFMLGFPKEIKEDIKKTIKFAKELNPTYASFHVVTPYPQTNFYNQVQNLNPQTYTVNLSQKELDKLARKAFMNYYIRPKQIISKLFNINSYRKQIKIFYQYITK